MGSTIHSGAICPDTEIRPTLSRATSRRFSIASRSEAATTRRALPSRLVLLGNQIGSSLSPVFQGAALAAAGIRLSYELFDVTPERLGGAIEELRQKNIAGNVTRPHKVAVHDACDVLTPLARRIRAVNTFWMEDGRLHGDNTDVDGFAVATKDLLGGEASGIEVLLLGSGGAAAAVLAAIERWPGSRCLVAGRDPRQTARLAARYPGIATVASSAEEAAGTARLIVNSTPVGQHNDDFPLKLGAIPPAAIVMDLVYRRGETAWVRALRERGNVARDGMAMLVEQGALSFSRWFGIEPDRTAMIKSLG